MTEENRQKRKAGKPLGRPGVPMHTFIVRIVIETADGPKSGFYWVRQRTPRRDHEHDHRGSHGDARATRALRHASQGR